MRYIAEAFDRVVVLNLARRAERMARFWQTLGDDWPFTRPLRFEAVDGFAIPVPTDWEHGAGAWGCRLSHCQILQSAISDGLDSILILEDDAIPVPRFGDLVADFLDRVPADWDCLMLGGQHLRPPTSIAPGIVRCISTHRTHAYVVGRKMMPGLLKFWEFAAGDHCDIVLAASMRHFKAYAPDPFLIGQRAGYSDVTSQCEQLRFLSAQDQQSLAA